MSLPFSIEIESNAARRADEGLGHASRDPRALRILAKTIYRELRQSGLVEEDLMCVAGELLSLVAGEVRSRRESNEEPGLLPR